MSGLKLLNYTKADKLESDLKFEIKAVTRQKQNLELKFQTTVSIHFFFQFFQNNAKSMNHG